MAKSRNMKKSVKKTTKKSKTNKTNKTRKTSRKMKRSSKRTMKGGANLDSLFGGYDITSGLKENFCGC